METLCLSGLELKFDLLHNGKQQIPSQLNLFQAGFAH